MRNKIIVVSIVAAIAAVPAFAALLQAWSTTGMGMAVGPGNTTGVKFTVNANRTMQQGTVTVTGNLFLDFRSNANGGTLSFPESNTLPSPSPHPSVSPHPSPSPFPSPPPRNGMSLSMNVANYSAGATPNAVEIGGPAVLRVVSTTGIQQYPGTATANLVSNRHPNETGDPDTIEVHFVPGNTGPNFDFAGAVMSGDILIRQTDSY